MPLYYLEIYYLERLYNYMHTTIAIVIQWETSKRLYSSKGII